jgi:hypothetical protein
MNARRKTARLVDRLSGQDSQIIVWSRRRSFFIASRAALGGNLLLCKDSAKHC